MGGESVAYSELLKNFNKIRDYMREFYVYGFRSRDEFTKKSARSYDDERRRVESWLGDYMRFRQTPDGRNQFLSIDSRLSHHNPLYKAWKAKSFTDGDITLHFLLFDILSSPEISLTLNEITERIDDYQEGFASPKVFDASTVRKKLGEYIREGLVVSEKAGKVIRYRRTEELPPCDRDALDFFSETTPCGVIGSFLLDKDGDRPDHFAFKHHYITSAMDSEILCSLFEAMREKRAVTIESLQRKKDRVTSLHVIPLRILISVQNGRQYLMAYSPQDNCIRSFRTDNILSVKSEEVSAEFDAYRAKLSAMQPYMWGVSTQSLSGQRMEHVEFTVRFFEGEEYIPQRLEREKRCGIVELLDEHTLRFSADCYDASEMIPWMRTFICRITSFSFSNKALEARFRGDLEGMYRLYGIGGGEEK